LNKTSTNDGLLIPSPNQTITHVQLLPPIKQQQLCIIIANDKKEDNNKTKTKTKSIFAYKK